MPKREGGFRNRQKKCRCAIYPLPRLAAAGAPLDRATRNFRLSRSSQKIRELCVSKFRVEGSWRSFTSNQRAASINIPIEVPESTTGMEYDPARPHSMGGRAGSARRGNRSAAGLGGKYINDCIRQHQRRLHHQQHHHHHRHRHRTHHRHLRRCSPRRPSTRRRRSCRQD